MIPISEEMKIISIEENSPEGNPSENSAAQPRAMKKVYFTMRASSIGLP